MRMLFWFNVVLVYTMSTAIVDSGPWILTWICKWIFFTFICISVFGLLVQKIFLLLICQTYLIRIFLIFIFSKKFLACFNAPCQMSLVSVCLLAVVWKLCRGYSSVYFLKDILIYLFCGLFALTCILWL